MHHFVTEICSHVHISVTKVLPYGIFVWCIVGSVRWIYSSIKTNDINHSKTKHNKCTVVYFLYILCQIYRYTTYVTSTMDFHNTKFQLFECNVFMANSFNSPVQYENLIKLPCSVIGDFEVCFQWHLSISLESNLILNELMIFQRLLYWKQFSIPVRLE